MANVTRPQGFRPRRHINGSAWNGQTKMYLIPSTDATATYRGDVVVLTGDSGAAGTVVAGENMEGIPIVTRATVGTTGQNIAGVVVDFLVDPTNLALKYRPASTNRVALVCIDPTVLYEVEEDAVTTPIAHGSMGMNVAFSLTAGSTVTGNSGMEIVSASVAVTATLPFKLVSLVKRIDNAFNTAGAGTDKAKFEVMLNTGVYQPNVAGI